MRSKAHRISGLLFLLTLFVAFSVNAFAQDEQMQNGNPGDDEKYKQTATELTQSLSQKVSLTAEQSNEINSSLINYQKNITEISSGTTETDMEGKISELNNKLKTEITGILDDKQLTVFNGIENQWFQEVSSKTHSATVRQSETKDKKY
jgi:hypothetical protein